MDIVKFLTKNKKLAALIVILAVLTGYITIKVYFFDEPSATKSDLHSFNASINENMNKTITAAVNQTTMELFKKMLPGFFDYSINCDNINPFDRNGSIFVNDCFVPYYNTSYMHEGNFLMFDYSSNWSGHVDKKYYLFDIVNSTGKSVVSLYHESGFICLKVSPNKSVDHIIKISLKDSSWVDSWLSDGFNDIYSAWSGEGRLYLRINGHELSVDVGKFQIDFNNSKLILGSDVDLEYPSNGYYDYIAVGKYSTANITVTFGPEESVNSI